LTLPTTQVLLASEIAIDPATVSRLEEPGTALARPAPPPPCSSV